MKSQDELIGKKGVCRKRIKTTKFSAPIHTTSEGEKFVDAPTAPLSTIPRNKEVHEELDDLNNKFSKRLVKMKDKETFISKKGRREEESDSE
ncbi:hypothetical protein RhiirA5_441176 [Rhizophagus irregularis]|uniref:Uncharacterized protein n=1 Tax=Rhizophagus irregularis TaxID=588596 RepID=A0A2N0R5J1_9GLOM|nr:hypothetical protein RhiirA5_441176 [Rhizophagus irregularis]PKC58574.1 hypothetical protein RhiirA1_470763 [Rhizophagus irregularis]